MKTLFSRKLKHSAFLVLLLVLSFAVVSCGGEDDGGEATYTSAAQPTQSSADQPTLPSEPTATAVEAQAEKPVERAVDGMVMIPIPAGEFLMGSDASAFVPEKPEHLVSLDKYWIDRTEVSNAQYRLCVDAGVCSEPKPWSDPNLSGDEQPALVLWEAAQTYCEWAGGRLPTEAEWEKAARGTDGRRWPWGNEFVPNNANLSSDEDGYGFTAPVGSYPSGASPYGLLDMAGNAAEWVGDWFDREYYAQSPASNPTGPASGEQKVIRSTISNAGGGPEKCRTIARYAQDHTRWEFGFRCVMITTPTASTTAAPAQTDVEVESPSGGSTVSDFGDLDALDSYRMRITFSTSAFDEGGAGFDQTMEMEWVRDARARRIVIASPMTDGMMEVINVGDTTWMKLGDSWIKSPSGQDQAGSTAPVDLDAVLQNYSGDMELVGEETINGIHAKHFALDSDVTVEGIDPSTGFGDKVTARVKGDLWIADESGLPAVVIRAKTDTDLVALGGRTLTISEEREVYDINADFVIELPSEATELPSLTAQPSEPDAQPTQQPTAPTSEQADPPPEITDLDSVDSYRLTISTTVQTGDDAEMQTAVTEEWVREPPARRLILSQGAGVPTFEYIVIGESAWMKLGESWMTIPESQIEDYNENLSPFLQPEPDMGFVGEETVNGFQTRHYTRDIESPMQTLHHEIWVVDQPDLPPVAVRMMYELETTSGQMSMVSIGEVNVTEINTPITIEPPQQ